MKRITWKTVFELLALTALAIVYGTMIGGSLNGWW